MKPHLVLTPINASTSSLKVERRTLNEADARVQITVIATSVLLKETVGIASVDLVDYCNLKIP